MTKTIELYWSHMSAYCYLVLDRALALSKRDDIVLNPRPVLPGVIRNAARFDKASKVEIDYFDMDVRRIAESLDLPIREPVPSPVVFKLGTWEAATKQPHVYYLYYLTLSAIRHNKGLAFLDKVARLLWDGSTDNWHQADHLKNAAENAGLEFSVINAEALSRQAEFDLQLKHNERALLEAGHWGVPTLVYRGEPFFGQDRFDLLLWRLGL
jgi:2-hydroxychromene-2-carboxylate isomerase